MKPSGVALSIFATAGLLAITGQHLEVPTFFRALPPSGRIPISEQTIVTQPGHYYLTEDIVASSAPAITVSASGVTLDLNHHTVALPVSSIGSVIEVEAGTSDVTIHDGSIVGGRIGIRSQSRTIYMEHLRFQEIEDHGVQITDAEIAHVLSSTFDTVCTVGCSNSYTDAVIEVEAKLVRIEDNQLGGSRSSGIDLSGAHGGQLVRNRIKEFAFGSSTGCGFIVSSSSVRIVENEASTSGSAGLCVTGDGNRIVDSTIHGRPPNRPEGGVSLTGDGNLVARNVIHHAGDQNDIPWGLRVDGSRNKILENTITDTGGTGMVLTGEDNLIQDNWISGSKGGGTSGDPFKCGILFGDPYNIAAIVEGNSYRDNTFRGNIGGAVCGDRDSNVDGGGNVYEALCGDGILADTEYCDSQFLLGETCQSLGYQGGTLLCNSTCTDFDTSGCLP